MRYRFLTADVFTDRIFGGNPLAVFPDAKGLDPKRMQATAKELNLSETVFVFPPDQTRHTRKLRIFTPGAELPFAGHPTVGTAHVLAAIGEIPLEEAETRIVFEEGVGPVPVTIRSEGGRPVFARLSAAKMPEIGPDPPSADVLAAVLSLDPSDITEARLVPRAVSCGVPFLFVPVRDRDALGRAEIDTAAWKKHLASYWAPQVFVLTEDAELETSQVRARMFAPALGIVEDPATGSAATALAGYLGGREEVADGSFRFQLEQGFEMGRPSLLHVEAEKKEGAIVSIQVGGSSVLVSEGEMEVP